MASRADEHHPPSLEPPQRDGILGGWLVRLGSVQAQRPFIVLLLGALLTVVGALLALRLELRTGLDQLLPESQPSVQELRRVAERTASVSNLFIVLEGDGTSALRQFGDALVPKLKELGPPWVGSSADGVHEARAFLEKRAGLFAPLETLEELRDDLQARWDHEVSKKLGTNLLDEAEEPEPIAVEERLRELAGDKADLVERYPDGYYQSKDGKALVVAVRTAIPAGELDGAKEAMARVESVVREVQATARQFEGVRVGYAGDLVTGMEEYDAVKEDLLHVGALGLGLVLGAVFLYYLRVRTLLALGIVVGVGTIWTFGLTELVIGHLNVATGFLVSILVGNGINFSIIYMARYLEARRSGASCPEAIRIAHRGTWLPTLTAASAAGAAYGSLVVTDFRGFKHFALIGGVGMLLCWLATYLLLPSVLAALEKIRPFENGQPEKAGRLRQLLQRGIRYDAPFVFLIRRFPRAIVIACLGLTAVSSVFVARYVASDPMEYDMKRIRNDVRARAERMRLSRLVSDIVGQATNDGMAIVVDRLDQVRPLVEALEARRDQAPAGEKPFESVHTIYDFVPEEQEAKLPVIGEIRDLVLKARERGVIDDETWAKLEAYIPPADLAPFGIADLPEDMARPFTERDGSRGRIVFIKPTQGESVEDAKYLMRWADSFRETTLPNGEVVIGSGRAVIYADMLKTVVRDAPKAIVFSLGATALVVFLAFRDRKRALAVLGALLVGVAWLCGLLALFDVKLNFLNFIALPITFGIGVDYAVNVVQRHAENQQQGRSVLDAIETTGGAVVLCSITTVLGYIALLGSLNQAVRSLGAAAVLGELACLIAAVLFVPAVAYLRERRRERAGRAEPQRA